MNLFRVLFFIFTAVNSDLLECIKEHCAPQAVACTRSVKCDDGIICIENCESPVTEDCAKNCIESNMDLAMISLGACASSYGCLDSAVRSIDSAVRSRNSLK
jgi:hypothetical protein